MGVNTGSMQRISVFGLGRVGHVLAICLADIGHQVIGVDVNRQLLEDIHTGRFHSFEPGVMTRLKRVNRKRFTITDDSEMAVRKSDISCIIVPTPSNTLGGYSLRYVVNVIKVIGSVLKKKKGYHLVVVVSTMLPGSSDHIVIPLLEDVSGRTVGRKLGYCYNPVFIALGEVVSGLIKPDFLLIGDTDKKAGDLTLAMHIALIKKMPPIVRMRPIEAEITKLASNVHETIRVSFANMLCALCAEIPGTNVDTVTGALAHRMGKRFFKGAVPYGGPCWPSDNLALAALMDAVGVSSIIPKMIDQFNEEYAKYILHCVLDITKPGMKVGILGLAYKAGTPFTDRSFGVDLARWLVDKGRKVIVWDPLAMKEAHLVLADTVDYATSGNQCLQLADAIVIVNVMEELERLNWTIVSNRPVLDCWGCLSKEQATKLSDYRPLGRHSQGRHGLLGKISLNRLRLLTK